MQSGTTIVKHKDSTRRTFILAFSLMFSVATQAKFPLWAAADLSFWTCLGRSRHKNDAARGETASSIWAKAPVALPGMTLVCRAAQG